MPPVLRPPRVMADGPLAPIIVETLNGEVEWLPWETALEAQREDIDAVYTYGHPKVDAAMLAELPNVRVISNYGVGVDHIDLKAAAERNIPVGNTPGILDGATADMGFTLLLATARRLVEGDRYARSPQFTTYDPGYMLGREVHSSTLGIIGLGRIGLQVAKRARGFDMQVLYHNRKPRPEVEQAHGLRYATLDELLHQSDYVMLCCPLTSETRHIINSETLHKMKPTATLVNISRGGTVDTHALYEALRDHRIAAAGLDVTEPEPLPREHPLLKLDNVVIAPHLGSATIETRRRMAEMSIENLRAGLAGKALPHRIMA